MIQKLRHHKIAKQLKNRGKNICMCVFHINIHMSVCCCGPGADRNECKSMGMHHMQTWLADGSWQADSLDFPRM